MLRTRFEVVQFDQPWQPRHSSVRGKLGQYISPTQNLPSQPLLLQASQRLIVCCNSVLLHSYFLNWHHCLNFCCCYHYFRCCCPV